VSAEYDADEQTMTVVADSASPAVAEQLADAYAAAYAAYLPTLRDQQVAQLDERREALRAQLETVEAQLRDDEGDRLASAELDSIVTQYQAVSAQRSTLQSIVEPGTVLTTATPAVALGLSAESVLAMALLLGLVAGVGLAFARRGLDFHVRSADEAADLARANVLAELFGVAAAVKQANAEGQLPITSRVASPFTESIRELRTATRVSLGSKRHSVVVVTAADPAAPRSFIAANLAASWALSGLRTVAFSGDLRRPQLDDYLPAPEGWAGEPDELRPTTVPNLELQPVPDIAMDPADFLATDEVRALVERLRDSVDVLVIDAPPALAAADATILGSYADGVVVLASAGKTDRVVLADAVERLRLNDVPVAGIALSGLRGDRRTQYASVYGDGSRRPSVDADELSASAASETSAQPGSAASATSAQPVASAASGASASSATSPEGSASSASVPLSFPPVGEATPDPRAARNRHAAKKQPAPWRPVRQQTTDAD
jgi:tyrosine-protein kinase Etk/Wzc